MSLKEQLPAAPLFLMDGTAYIYRAFYANRHMRRSDGFPTNSLATVTRILLRILREEAPGHFLFAMDGRGPTFRAEIYDKYKANREAMPEDLALQIEPVKAMARGLGISLRVCQGYEADDCIASLAAKFSPAMPVVIVSGDKDLKQCLGPNVFMWDPGAKEERLLTAAEFEAENGLPPSRWPDFQALTGDSSDNIPGAPGIGPKTARQIFQFCQSLEDIRDNLDSLPPKIAAKLEPHLEEVFRWRELTRLDTRRCAGLSLVDLAVGPINLPECEKLCAEFELHGAAREIKALAGARKGLALADGGLSGLALGGAREKEGGEPEADEKISDAGALPACANLACAIIWPEGQGRPCRLALGPLSASGEYQCGQRHEYEFSGKMADLCQWLAGAQKIIVADLKSLLASSPSWGGLAAGGASFMDLGLASYLLNPEDGDYSWKRISGRWREALECEESGPAILALAMARALGQNLDANGLAGLYGRLEAPLTPVLADMELKGVAIDPGAFRSFLDDVQAEMDSLLGEVFAGVGRVFNIRSSRQLGEALYGHLGLASGKKTRTGLPSTSEASLEKLAGEHAVVEKVLQFRKLDKMRSTYLDPLPRLMDARGRIHTNFNQEATATGRLSSSDPNLQNIPVRGPMGKRMRACFIAGAGRWLISADYSQIELRILAHLSQDPTLLDAFRQGHDIHARTAALIFDLPQERVGADERRMAKTINFGLLYGMGARKLAQSVKISPAQAKEFIDRYFSRLKTLKEFYDRILEGAREHGYVSTMAGRRRWLPGIYSANGQEAAQAQRQAVNTVIQGSAADVIKLAMLAVAHDGELAGLEASLLLQVHDELLLEAPEEKAARAGERVARLMESVRPGGQEFSIPLLVDWGTGPNWGAAH